MGARTTARLKALFDSATLLILGGNRDEQAIQALLDSMQHFKDDTRFVVKTQSDFHTPFLAVPESIREGLEQLDSILIREQPMESRVYGFQVILKDIRLATENELAELFAVVREYQLPVEVRSEGFGFNFGVRIYDHRPDPRYPDRPAQLCRLLQGNIPGVTGKDADSRMDNAYAKVWQLLPQTAEYNHILAFYGFKPLPDTAAPYHY